MKKVTFSWPFSLKDTTSTTKPASGSRTSIRASSRRQREKASRRSGKLRTPPVIAERDSSLYRIRVLDLTATTYSSSSSFSSCDTPTSTYHPNDDEGLYFPALPSRLSLVFDRRHTEVWDDLFDWAEIYRPEHNEVLTCQSQIDLRLPDNQSRRSSRPSFTGRTGLGAQSEIWSKVSKHLLSSGIWSADVCVSGILHNSAVAWRPYSHPALHPSVEHKCLHKSLTLVSALPCPFTGSRRAILPYLFLFPLAPILFTIKVPLIFCVAAGFAPHPALFSLSLIPQSYLNSMSTPTPIVPPRSRLRAAAPPPLQQSTSYTLPVDEPLAPSPLRTPTLSHGESSDHGSPAEAPYSPNGETVVFGGRKKSVASLGKDPLRVRDGASPRRSSSGVYTRMCLALNVSRCTDPTAPTFPGAQGPRPSHFPTHVYTPSNFQLNPTSPPTATPAGYQYTAGPSRSSSVSSTESESPITPASNSSRFSTFSGKALTGLKRISHQITSSSAPPAVKMPLSARDSYFPSSIGSDVPRVYTPQTPISASRTQSYNSVNGSFLSYGLGVGLSETNGRTSGSSPESMPRSGTVLFDDSADSKTSPLAKGRRKPVPRMLEDPLSDKMDEIKLESTHAI